MIVRFLCARAALAAMLALAPASLAEVFDGRVTGTENWVVGTTPLAWNWAANWHVDPFTHTLTLSHTLRLSAAAGSAAITAAELTNWETRIEAAWNRPDIYMVSNDIIHNIVQNWTLNYDVTLTTAAGGSPDYSVTVRDGAGGTDTNNWYRTGGSGVNVASLNVAAHETGHYLANPDEYNGGAVIPGSPHNAPAFTTTSLMNNTNATTAPVGITFPRHYWLWEQSMLDYFTHKGIEGKSITIVPTPATASLLLFGTLAAHRRRRGA